jgi:hypothetical protein
MQHEALERPSPSAARFALHSHHLAKLDRFVAHARRQVMSSGQEFAGVTIEIDTAGAVSAYAAGLEPLVLWPHIGGHR